MSRDRKSFGDAIADLGATAGAFILLYLFLVVAAWILAVVVTVLVLVHRYRGSEKWYALQLSAPTAAMIWATTAAGAKAAEDPSVAWLYYLCIVVTSAYLTALAVMAVRATVAEAERDADPVRITERARRLILPVSAAACLVLLVAFRLIAPAPIPLALWTLCPLAMEAFAIALVTRMGRRSLAGDGESAFRFGTQELLVPSIVVVMVGVMAWAVFDQGGAHSVGTPAAAGAATAPRGAISSGEEQPSETMTPGSSSRK